MILFYLSYRVNNYFIVFSVISVINDWKKAMTEVVSSKFPHFYECEQLQGRGEGTKAGIKFSCIHIYSAN
jgi:hypothetical protein